MDSRLLLPANTFLDGSYRIVRAVGSGGFGITYQAEDTHLGTSVAIKEYYPAEFADRNATMLVRPKSDRHTKAFEWGRSSFLQEARMLARFRHPSIVQVTRVFEGHSTAYMVMVFEQGHDFGAWLSTLGRPPSQEELDRIVGSLLDALELMHADNFLHRDIAPDNIIIRPDGTPVLLDFGAARHAVGQMSRTLTGIIKAGYSPHEQYSSNSRLQGPWSDVYALGATLYRAVTGSPPAESTSRVDVDHMKPAVEAKAGAYRTGFLMAIDACLRVKQSERPQSVAELRPLMLGRKTEASHRPTGATKPAGKPRTARRQSARLWQLAVPVALALLGGAYGGFEYTRWSAVRQPAHDKGPETHRQAALIGGEEARRRQAMADAAGIEARRKAEDEAESRRREEQRSAALEQARQREEEERRRADAEEKERSAEEARRREAEVERRLEPERRRLQVERERLEQERRKLTSSCPATFRTAGDELSCHCSPAAAVGTVWGTRIYTDDSSVCAAARHAGVIGAGGGWVELRAAPGQSSYAGSARNGISTANWQRWNRSFVFTGSVSAGNETKATDPLIPIQCPYNATGYRGSGQRIACHCGPEGMKGQIWGSGIYTDDSSICLSAVHAGVITRAGGAVTILILAGQRAYSGTSQNGVRTLSYNSWHGSFRFAN